MNSNILTPKQVAAILKLTESTIWVYIRAKKLPAVKLGKGYRILQSDLDNFIQENKT
jgi:excisionase family DNA binding protein